MNFNFGEVLTRAWQIIWKNKVLWVFGVLASCGQSSGNFNSNTSGGGDGGGFGQPPNLPPEVLRWFRTIEENITTILVILLAVVCIIWIISIFLGVIGKVGLIRGTVQAEGGADALVFGELFSGSVPYFWRMFGLSLILALPAIILAIAVAVIVVGALFASGGEESGVLAVFALIPVIFGCICLLIPVMFVLRMIFRQSERAIVLEEMSVLPAITRGWEVFRANLGPVILMAIILGVIGFIIGLVITVPVFLIVFPAMLAFAVGEGQNMTPVYLMGVCFCIYIPIAWLLQGIGISYIESAWTLTYLQLTKPQNNAPIVSEANA
jgi:hypothetical protein